MSQQTATNMRLLFCDNNAFVYLSEEVRFQDFLTRMHTLSNPSLNELLQALENNYVIKEPLMVLEYFWFPIRDINERSFNAVKKKDVLKELQNILDIHIHDFNASDRSDNAYLTILGEHFYQAMNFIHEKFVDLLCKDNDLSIVNALKRVKSRKNNIKNPSALFLLQYNFAIHVIRNEFDLLIRYMALENIFRYASIIFDRSYPNDKDAQRYWTAYIAQIYLNHLKERVNVSGYRDINRTIFKLNRKLDQKFSPTKMLSLETDTLDSYMIHFLSFGWFNNQNDLFSILVLTKDLLTRSIERVQQYQKFLAYAQNPISDDENILPQISHDIKPGILYVLDGKHVKLEKVIFYPAAINKDKNEVISSHSDIETFSL